MSSSTLSPFAKSSTLEFSFVLPKGTGKDSLDQSIFRAPGRPRSNLRARPSRWRVMGSRHVVAVGRTLLSDEDLALMLRKADLIDQVISL